MGKTEKEAREYARRMAEITGRKMLVFRVPAGTQARAEGLEFGTCWEVERGEYENGGSVFLLEPS